MIAPQRPPGFDDPLGFLAAVHVRLQQRCALLARFADHVRRHGPEPAVRATALHVMRMFDDECPLHHADEEEDLFPRLRAASPPDKAAEIDALLAQLVPQHAQLRELYGALRPQLETVADGRLGVLDRLLVDRLHTLCLQHEETEDVVLLPLARELLAPVALEAIGRAMAARRKAPYPRAPGD
jgi:hemerythrin-like domain-containing protein